MRLGRRLAALAVAAALVATVAGCASEPAVRTDPTPLTSRFPALAGLTSAEWMSGTLGDDRVPGPSSYWIDAVVRLGDADIAALRAGAGELREVPVPELASPLGGRVPEGRVLTSDALSAEVSSPGHPTSAWLVDGAGALILTSRFE